MRKILFKVKLSSAFDGEWDYFCEGGVGYRDREQNEFLWKVKDGAVMFRSGGALLKEEAWSKDSDEVQLAYQQWIAKLVTE